jgi:hypothetical protein
MAERQQSYRRVRAAWNVFAGQSVACFRRALAAGKVTGNEPLPEIPNRANEPNLVPQQAELATADRKQVQRLCGAKTPQSGTIEAPASMEIICLILIRVNKSFLEYRGIRLSAT